MHGKQLRVVEEEVVHLTLFERLIVGVAGLGEASMRIAFPEFVVGFSGGSEVPWWHGRASVEVPAEELSVLNRIVDGGVELLEDGGLSLTRVNEMVLAEELRAGAGALNIEAFDSVAVHQRDPVLNVGEQPSADQTASDLVPGGHEKDLGTFPVLAVHEDAVGEHLCLGVDDVLLGGQGHGEERDWNHRVLQNLYEQLPHSLKSSLLGDVPDCCHEHLVIQHSLLLLCIFEVLLEGVDLILLVSSIDSSLVSDLAGLLVLREPLVREMLRRDS